MEAMMMELQLWVPTQPEIMLTMYSLSANFTLKQSSADFQVQVIHCSTCLLICRQNQYNVSSGVSCYLQLPVLANL